MAIDPGRRRAQTAEPDRRESSGFEGRVIVFKHAGTAGGSYGGRSMKHIQVNEVRDLYKYAEKTYELGQRAPTQEFDQQSVI